MGKDEFLEGIDLVLKSHEVCNRLVSPCGLAKGEKQMVRYGTLPFIGVIDRLQADILFILKKPCKASQLLLSRTRKRTQTIEFRMLPVERQFGQEEVDVIS